VEPIMAEDAPKSPTNWTLRILIGALILAAVALAALVTVPGLWDAVTP
jgi:hypothetical protein